MQSLKEKYQVVLNSFCSKDDYHPELKKPFIQDEMYCATDGHMLLRLPVSDIELDFAAQEKPKISNVLNYDRPYNRNISIEKLKDTIDKFATKVKEYEIKGGECKECSGDGFLECDLGHEHDCDNCDGTGEVEGKNPTGKMIPDEKSMLIIWKSNIMVDKLQKLISACEYLGFTEVRELSADDEKNYTFVFGNFDLLIMRCMKCDGKNIYTDLV